ncbi:restriction endonuclease subunit S [Acinetobacter towneri]|uniref:restriction endonuclease subunit S n=1 Tax=Acinetobacter towneri TaxID=202956 RepID=UPI002B25683B|nr:restriction endonuclease subunit S [Acinetobacter towneri]WPC33020.1 restriction endonuclease subunit S [Acinetobacter towneri]
MMFEKYDAYKDSGIQWIGRIPEHWEIEKAKWIFLKADRPIHPNDGIVTCFRDGEVTLRSNRRTDGFTNALKEHGYQGIRKGDLVIHAMDAFAGAIGVSDSDGKSTPVYSACIPRIKNRINVHYYAYYLRNLALAGFIESLAKGIRERSTDFRFADFAELLLPFPKLEDQERIVAFLNQKTAEIDQAIAIKEQQIALLNERKQIVIQKAVTQGLEPNVPMKDSGVEWIGQIPEHWNTITKLKHIASLKGRQGWQGLKADEYIDEGPYVVSSAHFDGLDINWDKCPHVSIERYKMDAHIQLNIGDILLMKDGAKMGKMAYISNLPDLACLNSHLLLIRSLKTQDEFFFDSK